jgi:hypothetical protein
VIALTAMTNKPLLTDVEAERRAKELTAIFDRDPDVLSPDEQALAMTIKRLELQVALLENDLDYGV